MGACNRKVLRQMVSAPLDKETIQLQLEKLGLSHQDIAVHASLRSFGPVHGGAQSIVDALTGLAGTILMPAFCSIGRTQAPPGDRPEQNAWDYDAVRVEADTVQAFDPGDFACDAGLDVAEMGWIAATLLQQPGTLRSQHPSVSWAALGTQAAWYTADHTPEDPNQPLKRLVQKQGCILLLGADLTACTAVHLAEERAGRRPFIRWVQYADGEIRRIREYGCSNGFGKLAPAVEGLARSVRIGNCHAICYPIAPFVEVLTRQLIAQPELSLCGHALCRCQDAVRGGPIEQTGSP